MSDAILENVTYYDGEQLKSNRRIRIENGSIVSIEKQDEFLRKDNQECASLDCGNLYLYPALMDTHLHFPGNILFRDYGILLSGKNSLQEYKEVLQKYKETTTNKIHKGVGWNQNILKGEKELRQFREYTENIFEEEPLVIFSEDFHNAVCNQAMKRLLQKDYPDIQIMESNQIQGENIFRMLQSVKEIQFDEIQIEKSVLDYQKQIWNCGITAVQSLLFLGGNGEKEYAVMKRLDEENRLYLDISLACTVYPYESIEEIEEKYKKMRRFEGKRLHVRTLKLYLDGV
ncbi:MAG: amidohydrolase family protein, partial [Lachnospiraceae bacterium]|nr:amidohydrolase family protein [Lachnospiraceae bacterium]